MILHTVALPLLDVSVEQFSFSVPLRTATLEFTFKWLSGLWRAFCYFPDGSMREAGVFPNAANWIGFSDYRCIFYTEYEAITKENLVAVGFYILEL